jgi:hypothetical protein
LLTVLAYTVSAGKLPDRVIVKVIVPAPSPTGFGFADTL